MLNCITLPCLVLSLYAPVIAPDHGFNRIEPNNIGRCWRVINRDFNDRHRFESAVSFKVVTVSGTGETDDLLTYELTLKKDYVEGTGWDESQTVVYTGSGLITEMANGRINFEFYVELGNSEPLATGRGYYHPGSTSADSDDNFLLDFPPEIEAILNADPCGNVLDEGGDL